MHINNLETFKGLIKKFDLDDSNQLKVSSMYSFFEEATGFTSSLLNKKIDFNFGLCFLCKYYKYISCDQKCVLTYFPEKRPYSVFFNTHILLYIPI